MPVVVLGSLALAGYVVVRRALDSTVDEADLDPVIDVTVIESAVEENGLRAIADTETLDAAINDDELDSEIDVQHLQSVVAEKFTTVEQAVDTGDIESVLASEFDAATDRGLSAITEQEVIEGTVGRDEIGVSVDVDELRSALDTGTTALERTTDAIAGKIDPETDESLLGGQDGSDQEGRRIAVVDEDGGLESLVDESEPDTTDDPEYESIDIEDENDRTEDTGE